MADFLIKNLFRITLTILNYVSPSILADIVLHPFDFATVLLHIGYDPEGIKTETTTLVSVILQYALLTFYIPYLLTSLQGLQFMGMPHPSIFYYVHYIYSKEGFKGCYRGVILKILERLTMVRVSESIKKSINKGSNDLRPSSRDSRNDLDDDKFMENLLKNICSQFFAVLVSHPFHVLMVSSFAEFTHDKKSSFLELFQSIYEDDGYFGFLNGLTARLLGELLSLTFVTTYTAVINRQSRQYTGQRSPVTPKKISHVVNYVTYMSRFTAFKQPECEDGEDGESPVWPLVKEIPDRHSQESIVQPTRKRNFFDLLANLIHPNDGLRRNRQRRGLFAVFDFIPLTSKLFYYIMIRDYLSKKISNPFFLVCHCSIIFGTGWNKFPMAAYLHPLSRSFSGWRL